MLTPPELVSVKNNDPQYEKNANQINTVDACAFLHLDSMLNDPLVILLDLRYPCFRQLHLLHRVCKHTELLQECAPSSAAVATPAIKNKMTLIKSRPAGTNLCIVNCSFKQIATK